MQEYVDLLSREDDIKQIINIIEKISKRKNNTVSFAIEGEWGCGKSWLINKLASELYDMQDIDIAGGKYCVLKFNPWEYDYYDEPLLSLILSLKNQVNAENSIFRVNEEHKKMFTDSMKILANELVYPILDIISFVTVNPSFSIFGRLFIYKTNKYKKELDKRENEEKNQKKYLNPYIDLEELMKKIVIGLKKITKDKTIILLVDELDRCLPNYSIKVLERMHHLTQNVNNLQIIYTINRNQVNETIKKVYGSEIEPKEYLKKFISFSIKLLPGNLNQNFINQNKSIFENFDFIFTDNFDIEIAFRFILPNINMRERENILEKIKLVNSILNEKDEMLDYSILYAELLLVYCFYFEINIYNISPVYDNETHSIIISPLFENSEFLSPYFENLRHCHSVKHKSHGYEGFYEASIEYVICNLLKNLEVQKIQEYSIAWEQEFYNNSLNFLNNFVELYKSLDV